MTTECFIPKSFYASSRLVIRRALEIINDPENAGYKLTLRQIYYQFVSRNWLKNEQNAYKRLGEIWHERGSNFYDDMIEAFDDLDAKREDME